MPRRTSAASRRNAWVRCSSCAMRADNSPCSRESDRNCAALNTVRPRAPRRPRRAGCGRGARCRTAASRDCRAASRPSLSTSPAGAARLAMTSAPGPARDRRSRRRDGCPRLDGHTEPRLELAREQPCLAAVAPPASSTRREALPAEPILEVHARLVHDIGEMLFGIGGRVRKKITCAVTDDGERAVLGAACTSSQSPSAAPLAASPSSTVLTMLSVAMSTVPACSPAAAQAPSYSPTMSRRAATDEHRPCRRRRHAVDNRDLRLVDRKRQRLAQLQPNQLLEVARLRGHLLEAQQRHLGRPYRAPRARTAGGGPPTCSTRG